MYCGFRCYVCVAYCTLYIQYMYSCRQGEGRKTVIKCPSVNLLKCNGFWDSRLQCAFSLGGAVNISLLGPYFKTFMESRNRFQGMNSASLCSLAGRYDNPITPRFLAPIDRLKIPTLILRLSIFCSVPPSCLCSSFFSCFSYCSCSGS